MGNSTGPKSLGVIFDVDGVLVDSYRAHLDSWWALAEKTGCHRMTEDEFRASFGRTTRETIADLWPDEDLSPTKIERFDLLKEELFRDMLRANFTPIPGSASLISSLRAADFAIAAGSSGPPENVHLVLELLECRDLFDVVVTGDDVTNGKPDPEVFLTCASRLGLPTGACAVVEDAVVGVEAANQAGAVSVALVVRGRDETLFRHADHIVSDLSTLEPVLLRQWIRHEV